MIVKKQIYLSSLVFGAACLLIIIFAIYPRIKKIDSASQNFVLQKSLLSFFQIQVEGFKNFQTNFSLYEPIIKRVKEGFVDPQEPLNFVEFLEKEAEDAGLEIKITPLAIIPLETDFWENTGFQIRFGGKFQAFLRFLERIEKSRFLVETLQATIERTGEKNKPPDFTNLQEGGVFGQIVLKTFSGKALEVKK